MSDKESCVTRGRPRGFCVDQAVATAAALFRARGYDGVGVAELAAAIGINPPSLYAAFGSKRGLFERALDFYEGGEGRFLNDALAAPGSAEAVAERVLTGAVPVFASGGCLVLEGALNCSDADAEALTTARRRAAREAIRVRFAENDPERADLLADYLMTSLRGLCAAAREGVPAERLRAIAEIAARAVS